MFEATNSQERVWLAIQFFRSLSQSVKYLDIDSSSFGVLGVMVSDLGDGKIKYLTEIIQENHNYPIGWKMECD
jgi:hypothetical protein